MINDIGIFRCQERLLIYQDNKGVIGLMKGGGTHKRSKHFQIEFDALREDVARKEIEIQYMETENMVADMFTKSLNKFLFEKHRNAIMEKGAETQKEGNYRANLGGWRLGEERDERRRSEHASASRRDNDASKAARHESMDKPG